MYHHKAHAPVVVHRGTYPADAPEIAQREVAPAPPLLGRAGMARRTEVEVRQEAPREDIAGCPARVQAMPLRAYLHAVTAPPPALVAHREGGYRLVTGVDGIEVHLPHPGRRHTVAHHIGGKERIVVAMQEMLQPGYLAGRTCKEHPSPLPQECPCPAIGVADDALHVLRPTETGDAFQRVRPCVHHLPTPVVPRTEHHATPADNLLCQHREHPSRGTLHPHLPVRTPGGKDLHGETHLIRMEHGAHPHTSPATDAHIGIGLGVQEALPVGTHRDALTGTNGRTGMATRASFLVGNLYHNGPRME